MKFIGRKTLKSERARMKQINVLFLRIAQGLIILNGLFIFATWLSYRAAFAINEVSVSGAHATDWQEIGAIASSALERKLLFRIDRNNKLLYPSRSVLKQIQDAYPRIARATIEFPSPHQLVVSVEEYTPAFLYCLSDKVDEDPVVSSPGVAISSSASTSETMPPLPTTPLELAKTITFSDCYFADQNGYVFSRAPEYSGYPFLVILSSTSTTTSLSTFSPIGTHVLEDAERSQIITFIAALEKLSLQVHTVSLRNAHDVLLRTNMPWDILWSTDEDPVSSAKNLEAVLGSFADGQSSQSDLHTIDLRFGNKVFYR